MIIPKNIKFFIIRRKNKNSLISMEEFYVNLKYLTILRQIIVLLHPFANTIFITFLNK